MPRGSIRSMSKHSAKQFKPTRSPKLKMNISKTRVRATRSSAGCGALNINHKAEIKRHKWRCPLVPFDFCLVPFDFYLTRSNPTIFCFSSSQSFNESDFKLSQNLSVGDC